MVFLFVEKSNAMKKVKYPLKLYLVFTFYAPVDCRDK